MNPNTPQNTGSFGVSQSGIQALKQAAARRGIDIPVLDQVSGSAAQEQVAPGAPATNNVMTPAPTPPQASPQQQFRSAEAEIALKAMKSVVDTENNVVKSAVTGGLR